MGNPTFSKNSPYIVALDFIDGNSSTASLLAANIESGEVGEIWENARLNYPNYSVQDNQLIFDAEEDTFGDKIIGVADLNDDKISLANGPFIFIENGFTGARWGGWFATGQRVLVNTLNPSSVDQWAKVFPTVSKDHFTVAFELTESTDLELEVVDMLGRTMHREAWTNRNGAQQESLQLNVPAGSYLLRLRAEGRQFSQLIVVE